MVSKVVLNVLLTKSMPSKDVKKSKLFGNKKRSNIMDSDRFSIAALSCLGYLALLAILTIVVAFLMTWVWGWVVPDVFAGAVKNGNLPATITLFQAIKLSVFLSIIGLTGKSSSSSKK